MTALMVATMVSMESAVSAHGRARGTLRTTMTNHTSTPTKELT